VAEELVFGPEKVTTGAANDIEQATGIARRMVTQFGMSDKIGVIAVGDREQEIFLGREIGHRRDVSDSLAQMVDSEVKRIVDEAYERARGILSQNRELLDRFSLALLERETLDREEMSLLNRGEPLPPRAAPPLPPPPPNKTGASPAAVRTPMLGAPPAEPAGA
jgi:cell division protease FtsH